MLITNRQARDIMAVPVSERTPEQWERLTAWRDIAPEYDEVEFYD